MLPYVLSLQVGAKGFSTAKHVIPALLRWVFIATWLRISVFFTLVWNSLFKDSLPVAPALAGIAAELAPLGSLPQVLLLSDEQRPH